MLHHVILSELVKLYGMKRHKLHRPAEHNMLPICYIQPVLGAPNHMYVENILMNVYAFVIPLRLCLTHGPTC
jgi:hypothetical protein